VGTCQYPAPDVNLSSRDIRARGKVQEAKRMEASGTLTMEHHRDSWRKMDFELLEHFQFRVGDDLIEFPHSQFDAAEQFESTLLDATRTVVQKEIQLAKEDEEFDTEGLYFALSEQKENGVVFDSMNDDDGDEAEYSSQTDEQVIAEAAFEEELTVTPEEVEELLVNLARELETFLETSLPTTLTYQSARPCISYQKLLHHHTNFESAVRQVCQNHRSDCHVSRSAFGFLQLIMEELDHVVTLKHVDAYCTVVSLREGSTYTYVLIRHICTPTVPSPKQTTDLQRTTRTSQEMRNQGWGKCGLGMNEKAIGGRGRRKKEVPKGSTCRYNTRSSRRMRRSLSIILHCCWVLSLAVPSSTAATTEEESDAQRYLLGTGIYDM
jgi:hypothetical protein